MNQVQLKRENFVVLDWQGPFSYSHDGLCRSRSDAQAPDENQLRELLEKPGLYCIVGDHPLHGARSLLYIGQSQSLKQRFNGHRRWVQYEWSVEVYIAVGRPDLQDREFRESIESLLLYAHTPLYCARDLGMPPQLKEPLRIWNFGRYWRLYPELSSQHDWYLPF